MAACADCRVEWVELTAYGDLEDRNEVKHCPRHSPDRVQRLEESLAHMIHERHEETNFEACEDCVKAKSVLTMEGR